MLKENLMQLRNVHGYSQEEIADKIGISRQAYAKWESGVTVPDIDKCEKLAEIYGVSLDSLVRQEAEDGQGKSLPPAPKGKNIWGSVFVSERGQIVIPKAAREKFNIQPGSRLIVLSDENGIALIPSEVFETQMKKAMEMASKKTE